MAVCFIAPLAHHRPGVATTQGEVLYKRFRAESEGFLAVSDKVNRYHRLLDTAWFLLTNRRRIKIQCLSVYSGPSFVLADLITLLGKRLGQKIVLHLHGGGLPGLFARQPTWARRVLERGDAIVAPSMFLSRAAQELGLECRVIPNMICLEDYPYRRRGHIEPRLFWMRSFHPIWNPEMAVRVVARLREQGISATLVMGGSDKGSLESVKSLTSALHLNEYVRFAGFLDRIGKAREGDAADIFLNTNKVDNMPVAVVEACAMGLPVVSTNVGGIPDLLTDGETGLLVPSEDVAAMAHAVIRLISGPGLSLKLCLEGRKLAQRSAWPAIKEQWQSLFLQLEGAPLPERECCSLTSWERTVKESGSTSVYDRDS
jgi:glycosyltransferase involved in cell wall biosynthesis